MQGENDSTTVKVFDVRKFLQICLAISSNSTLIISQCEQTLCLGDSRSSQKAQQWLEQTTLHLLLNIILYYMHSRIGVFAVAHDLSFTGSKIFKRDHKLHFHYPLLQADLSSSRMYIVTPQQQAVSATYGWRKINLKGNSKAL